MGMPKEHQMDSACASVGNAMAEKSEAKAGTALEVTANAAKKIIEFAKKEGKDGYALRLKIMPGGCSGFTYGMWFEKKFAETDTVVEKDGAKVFIDETSMPMLQGSVLDYMDSLQGSGFAVKNPNTEGGCGCGKSFS